MENPLLNEAEIVSNLRSEFSEYIGDDGAVLQLSEEERTVITKDLLIEDVHFRTRYAGSASLAHKALHVNLSDLAAMGATPQFVLLGISIPLSQEVYAREFLESFGHACKAASVTLIGGDTTASPGKFFISVTAIGRVYPAHLTYRHTAHLGDLICVAGELGHAHLGLMAFEARLDGFKVFKEAFLYPTARVSEGRWLGQQPSVQSMMDLSDGLYIDLKRLCAASQLGASINAESLRFSDSFSSACEAFSLDPVQTALTGGEDYGLLFTVHPQHHSTLDARFRETFGYDLKTIGTITNGQEVRVMKNGQPQSLDLFSFSHFGEPA